MRDAHSVDAPRDDHRESASGGGRVGAPDLDDSNPLTKQLQEGLRLNGVARFGAARRRLDKALRDARELDGWERDYWTSRLLLTRAYTTMETVGQPEALAELRDALELGEAIGSARLVTLARIQESNIHFRATRWEDAVRAATAAALAGGRLRDEERYALLLNRGFALVALRRLGEAEQDLRRAHDVAQASGSKVLLFKAVHNLGCLAWVQGDLPRALDLMGRADAIPADIPRDRAWLDQAQVLIEAGLVDRARARLHEALATARLEGHRLEEGAVHLDLARCAIHDGDLRVARTEAQSAVERFTAGGATLRVRRAELTLAGIDLAAGTDLDAVERAARSWLAHGADPVEDRAALRLLAETLLTRGAVDECAALLGGTGPQTGLGAADELHEYLVLVQLEAERGNTREVTRLCRRAARRLATYQRQAQSLELRAAVALHGDRLAAFDIERAVGAHSARRTFASVERWRSASHRVSPLTPPSDPVIARLLVTLRHTRHQAAETGADLRAEIHRLEDAVTRRELSRARSGKDAAVVVPASLARTRAATLATQAAVVQLFVNDGLLHVVVVSPHRVVLRSLGPAAAITAAVRALSSDLRATALAGAKSPLAAAVNAALADSLRRVDDELGSPLARLLPETDGPVVVSPPGAVAALPWSMLPSWRGRPVLLTPSVTRWVHLVETRPTGTEGATAPRPHVQVLAGPGLPHAADEVCEVAEVWGATEESDHVATSATVRRALARADVVHIAAHGTHEDQNPLFASLRLADGPLFVHEFPTGSTAQHVVLSACDVGRSRFRPGDEPLGFAAALLARGIPSVVAAVAPVPDDATAAAMVTYHRHLARGTPATQALSRAIAEVPAAGAFCLFGADWAAAAACP